MAKLAPLALAVVPFLAVVALVSWLAPPAIAAGPAPGQIVPDDTLSFEAGGRGGAPLAGWSGIPEGTVFLDSTDVHAGRYAARMTRTPSSPGEFSALVRSIPVTFMGDTLEIRGWLKLDGVTGFAGLWLREDVPGGVTQFDNMESRAIRGTRPWREYRLALPLDRTAKAIVFGATMAGQGTVHADDLQLLVDGKDISLAPPVPHVATAVDTDHEFDHGSRVQVTYISPQQTENLALLARVWGFLKYHHPRAMSAQVQWDYELFRMLPPMLAAPTHAAAIDTLVRWLGRLGVPASCSPCASLPRALALRPRLEWLSDRALLGDSLSDDLQRVYRNRPADGDQYYVSLAPGAHNPDLSNEAAYAGFAVPDAGYRLLALFRFWNIIEYWYPYRDLLGDGWSAVLTDFIPSMAAASTQDEYRLTMLALVARLGDTHATVYNAVESRPPLGGCRLPVVLRPIGSRFVVGAYTDPTRGAASGLEPGDVILALDGIPVDSLAAAWAPYYGASNDVTRRRDIAWVMTRGVCGPCLLTLERGGNPMRVTAVRDTIAPAIQWNARTHDLPGPTFRLLSPEVAYLKLSTVHASDVGTYIRQAAGTRCLVVDIRNYPGQNVVLVLGGHLVQRPTPFALFTHADLANPGAMVWGDTMEVRPEAPSYRGKVVILVDEVTQSHAEYTAMGLRSAPGAIVVGSTTAGADGNVSDIPLPGGLRARMTGIGVFYPDGRPTQRVGIVPDLVVVPTVGGLQAGEDEVLEAALQQVLGHTVPIPPP